MMMYGILQLELQFFVVFLQVPGHIVPEALTSPTVVTVKNECFALTLGLHRTYKYNF